MPLWLNSSITAGGIAKGLLGFSRSMRRDFKTLFYACQTALFVIAGQTDPAAKPGDLDWHSEPGFRFAPLTIAPQGRVGFILTSPTDTGITFANQLRDTTVAGNRLTELGSGVALGDVDGDGWVDIYFCGLDRNNVLYRNLGNWKFQDITAESGVACSDQLSTGCALADLDGDTDLDLLVNSLGGGTRIFLNNGKGHFAPLNGQWPARQLGATSLALADVDGNGLLDLYVTNYRTDTIHDHPPGLRVTSRQRPDGTPVVEPGSRFLGLKTRAGGLEVIEKGEIDFFYINLGNGKFSPVPWEVGVFLDEDGKPLAEPTRDWGLSVIFRDLNGDRLPDLYVCNDFVNWPDRVWMNEGGKRFRAASRNTFRSFSLSSMAVDVADVNRDGYDDLFVAEMLSPHRQSRAWQRPDTLEGTIDWPVENPDFRPEVTRNTLHLARGDGTFAEIAQLAGVAATDWTWAVAFLDVDLDGWEDLLVATGNNHDVQDMDVIGGIVRTGGWKTPELRLENLKKIPKRETPGMTFRNRRDLTFEDTSALWGFDAVGIANGMALADLDNDGDLDVAMNCLHAPARIYRNGTVAPRIAVRLKGAGPNTHGIGARIRVSGGPVVQSQEIIAGGRYLSSDDPMRVFATGNAETLEIEVLWRSGPKSIVRDALPNRVYEIAESPAPLAAIVAPQPAPSLFEDWSARLNHVHADVPFDDFSRQPLLPRKLSTLGPGLAWADTNDDGFDDLIIAGGSGARTAIFQNDRHGGFAGPIYPSGPDATNRDQTTILVRRGPGTTRTLLIGASNWEDANPAAAPVSIRPLPGDASGINPLGNGLSSTGPLALADVEGDGELDLFVGGRVVAGRYPEPATSHLLRGAGARFEILQTFPALGLVSGAVFTDFDGDGDPDLALACEWDSVRLFRNDTGRLTEITDAFGMSGLKGFWNGIAAGDFDGDGRMDLVASNWGRNWRTDGPANSPVHLFWGNLAGDSVIQTLLASADPDMNRLAVWRAWTAVTEAIPQTGLLFPTHHAFGGATVREILGEQAPEARELLATHFDSTVFLNRGDHFEARALPIEAQFAPAFGVTVADLDGDGAEDIFLANNFFGVDAETSRHDGGVGLVLLGDGRGGFRALPPLESGIAVYGEQRASAVADFDGDGRADLALTQNRGATRLFRNAAGKPGLRIRLIGSKENPDGVGAILRLARGGHEGPARELHAGSGYWSQDASTVVVHLPGKAEEIHVRWPAGLASGTLVYQVPDGAREVHLRPDGSLEDGTVPNH